MTPRILYLFLAFSLYSFRALSQAYEPGLLVLSTGDTLRGEVENGFWTEPPTFIRYRPAPGASSQLFAPRQLRAVSFTKGRYFRYEALPIDYAAEVRLERLPQGFHPDVRIDSVLAEVLLEGPTTMLRVGRFTTTHYLLLRPGLPILDLTERKYLLTDIRGRQLIADGNNFRGQLEIFFGDCPAAQNLVRTAAFTEQDLAGVVEAYNTTCVAAPAPPTRSWLAYSTPRRRLAFRAGLLAGTRYNRIESVYGEANRSCVDCKPRPFAGLYAELFQPSRLIAAYGELTVSRFQSRGSVYSSTQPGALYTPFAYRAWLGTARLGVRLFFPLPKEQQWLVGFGYELNKVMAREISAATALPSDPDRRQLQFAYPTLLPNLSLGWRTNRVTVSVDGQLYASSGATDDSYFIGFFLGNNYALRLGLAYRLGRNPDAAGRP